jgi:hypothetical protein
MPTQQRATKRSAISIQMRTQKGFDSNLVYMDHTLPPLGYQTQFSISKSPSLVET